MIITLDAAGNVLFFPDGDRLALADMLRDLVRRLLENPSWIDHIAEMCLADHPGE